MATQLQIRRGSASQVAAFTGAEGEIVVNTTNDSVHVNDGSTQGGFELARVDGANWAITNAISTTNNISFGDNDKAIFGAGSDLQIYHDASDSIILDNGTGNLKIQANDLVLKNADGSKEYLKGTNGGSVRLRHNNTTILETTSTGIALTSTAATDVTLQDTDGGFAASKINVQNGGRDLKVTGPQDIIFNVGSSDAVTILNGGNVGLGLSSPNANLHISSAGNATNPALQIGGTTTYRLGMYIDSEGGYIENKNGDNGLIFRVKTAGEAMRISANGYVNAKANVALSNAPDTQGLHFGWNYSNGAGESLIVFNRGAGTTGGLTFVDNSSSGIHDEIMRLEGGNLGLGTSNPSTKLTVAGDITATSTGPSIFLTDTDSNPDYQIKNGNGTFRIIDTTNSVDRLNIDSSGNFLVGKTSTSGGIAGSVLAATGLTRLTAIGIAVAEINRLSSDGSIVDFKKDGTTVGSIGTVDADLTVFSKASGHKGLRFGNGYIGPTNNAGTIEDNSTDLGLSTHRFQDLYLSGGAYLGGTTSANYLDDYEEGTFTPAFVSPGTGAVHSIQIGTYTKVGRLVTASVYLQLSTVGTGAGNISVSGFPFATSTGANDRYSGTGAVHGTSWAADTGGLQGLIAGQGATSVTMYKNMCAASGTTFLPTHADMGGGNLLFTISYFAS